MTALNTILLAGQLQQRYQIGFSPASDVLAGGASQEHVVSSCYTLCNTPRALAANAMYQHWKQDVVLHGKPGMLWIS